MKTSSIVTALAALAQASRLQVFRLLVQTGEQGLSAGKIAELIGITPSALSFHLKELSHAELVHTRQVGRFVIYSANYPRMNDVMAYLTENCCGGTPCLPVVTCQPAAIAADTTPSAPSTLPLTGAPT